MTDLLLALQSVFGSLVASLIVLAVSVKLLLLPLVKWASKGVAANQALALQIEPELKLIKANYKGEEQSERILALYKRNNFNPFLSLKSTLVLLVQIPIFVGVFVSVSSEVRFAGERLWLISDVTEPDGMLSIFGFVINLLPILMLAVSIGNLLVMRRVQQMQRSQELTGWVIAFGFFVLLYGSAAALVIYWTVNIVLQWLIDWLVARSKR